MRPLALLVLVPLALGCLSVSHAAVMVTRFEGDFTRQPGTPRVEERSFPAAEGPATLTLRSLNHETASAEVRVNGTRVFSPSDFNHRVSALQASIVLAEGDNRLEVLLRGRPGTWIRIEIAQPGGEYSGTYCLTLQELNSIQATTVVMTQTGESIALALADLANLSLAGTLSGHSLAVTGQIPNAGDLTMLLVFSEDGQTVAGTYTLAGQAGTVTGSKTACAPYDYPADDPVCQLPVQDPSLVVGGQQYNSVSEGVVHTGLDFAFSTSLPEITAPCAGVVKGIRRHAIAEDNIIFDVDIRYNQSWGAFVAFEPYSPDPAVAAAQQAELKVIINQILQPGDLLGRLVVPDGSAYPHVHWGVYRNDVDRTPVCPGEYLAAEARAVLDELYGRLLGPDGEPLLPPCLP